MAFVADLHIHSHYSISTSPELDPEHLELAARRKGVTLVGTGDFTHPGWRADLREKLEPAEAGLFSLKPELRLASEAPEAPVRFLLTAEVSGIYRRDGRVRKVHSILLLPDLASAERVSIELGRIGNIAADGRPVLALDARDLLEILLEASPEGMLIPAHIWTPWFSALGAKSGFDSIEECFRDLHPHIRAVETGLSSDPPMNWMCGSLDRFTLVSSSDAHSPDKLGREANLLDTELSYAAVTRALREGAAAGFRGTIEFFPEEGKYHLDGHRACGVRQEPAVTRSHDGICPVCGKEVTVGVLHRVLELSDRAEGHRPPGAPPFHSLVPLREILAELAGKGAQSKAVASAYEAVLAACGTELGLLLELPVPEIERRTGELLAEAIRRMRSREVIAEPGYDGEYGVIKLFRPGEIPERAQSFLLPELAEVKRTAPVPRRGRQPIQASRRQPQPELPADTGFVAEHRPELDPDQREAALHGPGPALVIAGPGTGKTRTLTYRLFHLVVECRIEPERILVVTFTNRAAGEIRERLAALLGVKLASRVRAGTFHAFGLSLIEAAPERWGRKAGFALYDEEDRAALLAEIAKASGAAPRDLVAMVSEVKRGTREAAPEEASALSAYEEALRSRNAFDLDDLVTLPTPVMGSIPHGVQWLLVDELQDIDARQYAMIRALMPGFDANLFAIGDPDQAIYGFRGGDPALALKLAEDYPGTRTYALSRSHRCPRSFLRASARVLRGPGAPTLEATRDGARVRVVVTPSERSEAELVARTVEDMMGGLRFFSMDSAVSRGNAAEGIRGLGDFAVLVRMTRMAEPIRAAFDDHAIPYSVAGERSPFEEEPCRSILALLALGCYPADGSLKVRLQGRERVRALAASRGGALEGNLASAAAAAAAEPTVVAMVEHAARRLLVAEPAEQARVGHLRELAGPFRADLAAFLRFCRLGSTDDGVTPGSERVAIMTLHAAKGLEFPCVFIVGCEEGIIPLALEYFGGSADLEEERRLLYVGMTRASRLLVLTHAKKRTLFGRTLSLPRSSFLSDLDEESFEELEQALPPGRGGPDPQLELGLQ